MTVFKWSQTAATNASADSTINWAEGQAPSSVNDSARAVMAAVARWRDDIGGTLVTAGTASAYTIATTNQNFTTFASPPPNGTGITFTIHATNNASATLSIDGGTAYPLQTASGAAVAAGILVANAAYTATFKTSVNAWFLNNVYNFAAVSIIAPIGSITPYAGVGDPSANFLICDGRQTLLRASYPFLFNTVWGGVALFGSSDGSHFNLPDLRGRVIAGIDNMGGVAANRITTLVTDSGTIVGSTFGSTGGSQSHQQTTTEMATHNHTTNETPHQHSIPLSGSVNANTGATTSTLASAGSGMVTGTASTGLTINNAGSGTAMALLQPTMMLSYIIRVL